MIISSTKNDYIIELSKLKENKYRKDSHFFLLEDYDLIIKALSLNLIDTILFEKENVFKEYKNCNFIEVTSNVISKLSNLKTPSKFIAVCKKIEEKDLGNRIVILDGVQDPGNGGTILRSALAFNFTSMVVSTDSFDLQNDKFIRATKGAYFDLPVLKTNLLDFIDKKKEEGFKVIIAQISKTSIDIDTYKIDSDKIILVVGSEGQGISKEVQQKKDLDVYIKMNPLMESLNVAVACSIIMSKLQ